MTKTGPQDNGADLAFGADLALSILQCVKHGLNSVYITDTKSFNRLAFGPVSFHTKKGAPDSLNFQTKRRKKNDPFHLSPRDYLCKRRAFHLKLVRQIINTELEVE